MIVEKHAASSGAKIATSRRQSERMLGVVNLAIESRQRRDADAAVKASGDVLYV